MFIDNLRMMLNEARNAIIFSGNIESISVDAITEFASSLMSHIGLLWDAVRNLVVTAAGWIKVNLPVILEAGRELISKLIEGIKNNLPGIAESAWQTIQNFMTAILQNLPQILQTGITLMGKLLAGILNGISALLAGLPQVVQAIVGYFKSVDWGSVGKNIIAGIANGLKAAGGQLWDAVKGVLGSFKENVLAFFGIHSPSRWGDYVGRMIDSGIAGGVSGGAYMIQRAIDAITMGAVSPVENMMRTQSAAYNGYGPAVTNGTSQIIELLSIIAEKDTRIILNDREVNRALRGMGVAYN